MKKLILMLLTVLALSAVCIENVEAASKSLTPSEVANGFNSQVGKTYPSGYCLKFVADIFASLGATRSSSCCAYNYGSSHIVSTSMDNIPIGADVFFGACGGGPCKTCKASYYGHIGVYVGNGYFVHATGGKVQKTSLPGSSWKNKYRGWGYHSNVTISQSSSVNVPSSETTANPNADNIRYNVEKPADGLECSDDIQLEGWFIYRSGDVSEVVCYLNGIPVCNCERIQRPDVSSAFPGYSAEEGFRCNISKELFQAGQNQIFFRAFTNGNTQVIADFGHRTITYQPRELRFYMEELPNDLVTTGVVRGWIIADSEVRVTVVLNGIELEVTDRHGRSDVKTVFPSYDVSQAGFRYVINASQVMHGTNYLSVRVYTSDTQYTEIYSGTFQAVKTNVEALFDMSYYYGKYSVSDPIIKAIGRDYGALLEDYFGRTLVLGYEPSLSFSPSYYLSVNDDVAAAYGKENYLAAYKHMVENVQNGTELRKMSPYLDLAYYKKKYYGELGKMSPGHLLYHYTVYGLAEGRQASSSDAAAAFIKMYNAAEYAKNNPDIEAVCGDAATYQSKKELISNFFLYMLAENDARITSDQFDFRYVSDTYGLSALEAFEWYTLGGGYTGGYTVKSPASLNVEVSKAPMQQKTEISENVNVDMPEKTKSEETERQQPELDEAELEGQEVEEFESEDSESADPDFEEEQKQEQGTLYRVTFKSNGKVTAEQKVAKGMQATVPKTPVRKGYLFAGWYLGKKPYDFESKVTGNITITAKWKKASVGKAAIKSLKCGSGELKISYKKTAWAKGYEIQCATSKKFQIKNTVKKSTGKTSCKITGLKENRYYIRVRAYVIDSMGKRVYGKWSKVKMMQVKD